MNNNEKLSTADQKDAKKMAKGITEDMVREAIAQVEHPTIAHNLIDLGMVKSIAIKGKFVRITLAFPFAGMTEEKEIIKSLRNPIKKLGGEPDVESTIMTQDELKKYFAMEMQHPKGDI